MSKPIPVSDWCPSDGIHLEETALRVVKSTANTAVIAGPGAGKTEVLAQRACLLLETGICRFPRKILAISFKVDAADNLAKRVKKRCGEELASRFESRTYDSFSKHLVDQFRNSIDERYRPAKNYDVLTDRRELKEYVSRHVSNQFQDIRYDKLMMRLSKDKLPIKEEVTNNRITDLTRTLWHLMPLGSESVNSTLTFGMITRLAEYLVRSNQKIMNAIRTTYSHVFLDEFQDTTDIQYDLLKTIFLNSSSVLTAVGDDKQRIMVWAGALKDAFPVFQADFAATEERLLYNHRSAPKLIAMQNVIARDIDPNSPIVVPSSTSASSEGECQIWKFRHYKEEADHLVSAVKKWLTPSGTLHPRDICIIVKQQEDIYGTALIDSLSEVGLQARIEKEYQELLAEECVEILINMLTLATRKIAPHAWKATLDLLILLKSPGGESERTIQKLQLELGRYIRDLSQRLSDIRQNSNLNTILFEILDFFGTSRMYAKFPKYAGGKYINKIIKSLSQKLWHSYSIYRDWDQALLDFRGEHSIPIMTIHKSKGLEYNTVIFIGLEDAAFWNFVNQSDEDKRAFFVAFSRAKERVIFTFSDVRETMAYFELKERPQSSKTISVIYDNLKRAGAEELEFF